MYKITLRQARALKGYTQKEAAKLSGLHHNTIRDAELGNKSPTIDTVKKLCDVYGISLEQLNI